MSLRIQTNTRGSFDLLWNDDVVAIIKSKDAADELREALWLLPHLSVATAKCIEILQKLQSIRGENSEADRKFIIDTNFILELLRKQNLFVRKP